MRHYQFAAALVLLVPSMGFPAVAQECAPGALSLEARTAHPLPVTFGIEGVVAAPGGRLSLWSAEGEILSLSPEGAVTRLKLPDSIRPAGVAIVPEGIRILDRYSGREFRLSAEDVPSLTGVEVPVAEGEKLDQAILIDNVWLAGLRDAFSHEFRVLRGGATVYHSAPGPTVKTTPRFLLSADQGTLLLTHLTAPFELIRLSPDGRVDTLARTLPAALAELISPDSLPNWRALPAVAIDCGLLLTLSDLTGDRRLLVRVSAEGQLVRVTSLEAPFGLVARLPGEAAVLAARRVGNLELVWYDWRWIRESAVDQ